LHARGAWDAAREARLLAEVTADVDRALAEAASAGKPGRASLFDDVYAELPWHLAEQRDA
ncbi:MAG: thiamine pyrophosphate-dependent dehydrogenase E1 component subunit alpha, partial [Polyangiaceae bacterium]